MLNVENLRYNLCHSINGKFLKLNVFVLSLLGDADTLENNLRHTVIPSVIPLTINQK